MKRLGAISQVTWYRLALLLTMAFLSACASPRNLEFRPLTVLPVLPVKLQAPPHFEPIGIARPIDSRTDKEFCCGVDLNPAAPILSVHYKMLTPDAAIWVGNAVASGLENGGYEIVPVQDAKAANTDYVITIDVTEVGLHQGFPVGTYVVGVAIELNRRGTQLLKRHYQLTHRASMTGNSLDSQSNAANAFNRVLEELLPVIVTDLATEIVSSSAETHRLTKADEHATQR